jgi:hypothetical protein
MQLQAALEEASDAALAAKLEVERLQKARRTAGEQGNAAMGPPAGDDGGMGDHMTLLRQQLAGVAPRQANITAKTQVLLLGKSSNHGLEVLAVAKPRYTIVSCMVQVVASVCKWTSRSGSACHPIFTMCACKRPWTLECTSLTNLT